VIGRWFDARHRCARVIHAFTIITTIGARLLQSGIATLTSLTAAFVGIVADGIFVEAGTRRRRIAFYAGTGFIQTRAVEAPLCTFGVDQLEKARTIFTHARALKCD
jgi:hypothetical protein